MLPHLGAAFNLAMYLLGNREEAEDAVQTAYLNALRAFGRFEAGNSAAWILTIVRHRCYTLLGQRKRSARVIPFDEESQSEGPSAMAQVFPMPDQATERYLAVERVRRFIRRLPLEYREVIVLREIEGLAYREIAAIAGIPQGTVMSRLSRARQQLKSLLVNDKQKNREQDDAL